MNKDDKRRYLRFETLLGGTFKTESAAKEGLIMLTDVSKAGFRGAINRKISPHEIILVELKFPGSDVPVFAKGKIIWIKKSSRDWTFEFDVGLRWVEIGDWDKERIMDFAYENWRGKKLK